jgi:hypothetical protein
MYGRVVYEGRKYSVGCGGQLNIPTPKINRITIGKPGVGGNGYAIY